MLYLVFVAVVVLGIMTVLYAQVCHAEQERDVWKAMADEASLLFRTAPMDVHREWDYDTSRWVTAYNALLEPEA